MSIARLDGTCVLDCRLDGELSASCTPAPPADPLNVVTMYLPLNKGLTKTVKSHVGIDTRGCDYSATGNEGIRWRNPGFYILKVEVFNGATLLEES